MTLQDDWPCRLDASRDISPDVSLEEDEPVSGMSGGSKQERDLAEVQLQPDSPEASGEDVMRKRKCLQY